jgi:predicted Zn-dependent protease with MMP-like domain
MTPAASPQHWHQLETLARAEVQATLADLPAELRAEAGKLPVIFEPRPGPDTLADGTEPDTLGQFIGGELDEIQAGCQPLPPQIVLYLENLWEYAEAREEIFADEVRITLLHELGHYLGLDELDLEDRGLE